MIKNLRSLSRLSRARSSDPRPPGRALRIGVLGVVVPCLLGCGSAAAIAATTTPSTTTNIVTAPTKTVTQTQTTTAPAKTTTVTTPTQTNTVIKTQTTTAPTTTTSKGNAPAAALGAAASAASHNASKSNESSGLPGWAWALIGAAVVALLVWIVIAVRHWRKGSPPGPGTVPPADGPSRPAPTSPSR